MHNRVGVSVKPGGAAASGAQTGAYQRTAGAPLFDREMNQYTETPLDRLTYDLNGNLRTIAPQATGLLIAQLSQGQNGASAALNQAALNAVAEGDSWLDLVKDDALDGADLLLLDELLTGIWNPNARLAELTYDYRNQMVEYGDGAASATHRYGYDCFGRRTRKVIDVFDNPLEIRFVHGGGEANAYWQVLEEFIPPPPGGAGGGGSGGGGSGGGVRATNVWCTYIDEIVQRRFDPDSDAGEFYTPTDFFYHADDLFSVTAVSNAAGAVVERYEYGDYGRPVFLLPNGNKRPGTPNTSDPLIQNPHLFTGREFDAETGLLYYRTRYMDSGWGRFTTRDTIGVWGDHWNTGSGSAYVGSRPLKYRDPFGLWLDNDPDLLRPSPPPPFDPVVDPVTAPAPQFKNIPDSEKRQLHDGAQKACKRAQCALQAIVNTPGDVHKCLSCDPAKNPHIDLKSVEKRLRQYLSLYCRGKHGSRLKIKGRSDIHEPQVRDFDWGRWIEYPINNGRIPRRNIPQDLIHEPFHQMFDTEDEGPPNDNQHDLDIAIQCAANKRVAAGDNSCR